MNEFDQRHGHGYHSVVLRRSSRPVFIGNVQVGGGAPVSVQTMAKAAPDDVDTIVSQLRAARAAGCDIARIAVPTLQAAGTIRRIKERSGLPIIADVHFDHRIAVEAAQAGADGLRINPGNISSERALRDVAAAAAERKIPVRVGVNAGSMPKHGGRALAPTPENISETALRMCERLERLGFENLKVSLKAFDVRTTVEANMHFARRSPLPLHIGVTEAGPVLAGTVRSAAALGILLHQGVGDTLRVSLSASPEIEVRVGVHLLRSLGLRKGPVVVSCPTCGRTRAPVQRLAARVERLLERLGKDVVVAVMGCEVNGPGEARQADIGVAFGPRGTGLLFERGKIVESAPVDTLERLLEERLTTGDWNGEK